MARLEFVKLESKEELQNVVKALLSGEKIERTYTDSQGVQRAFTLVNNGRLYFINNHSIGVSKADDGSLYISVNYFSVDERIQLSKKSDAQSSADDFEV